MQAPILALKKSSSVEPLLGSATISIRFRKLFSEKSKRQKIINSKYQNSCETVHSNRKGNKSIKVDKEKQMLNFLVTFVNDYKKQNKRIKSVVTKDSIKEKIEEKIYENL